MHNSSGIIAFATRRVCLESTTYVALLHGARTDTLETQTLENLVAHKEIIAR
jgi:hypothetical protein